MHKYSDNITTLQKIRKKALEESSDQIRGINEK